MMLGRSVIFLIEAKCKARYCLEVEGGSGRLMLGPAVIK